MEPLQDPARHTWDSDTDQMRGGHAHVYKDLNIGHKDPWNENGKYY